MCTSATRKGPVFVSTIFLLACLLPALLFSSGCAREAQVTPSPVSGPETPCETLYTFAPGFLVVDLAAGSDIFLDPAAREFPVFCSTKEAHASLVARVSQGLLPRGDWQIFRLKGGYKELGTARGPGNYVLRTPARLAEWCPEQSYR